MTHTHTRTHVLYFAADDVKHIIAEVEKLEHDFVARCPHMPREFITDGIDRIEAVRLAVKRLTDIVPE